MIKKLTLFLLTAFLLLALAACGGTAPSTGSEGNGDGAPSANEPVILQGGSDQKSAESVPLDTKLSGKTSDEESQWYSFTTDETENATYKITAVNQTPKTDPLDLCIYDAEGEPVENHTIQAKEDGKATTYSIDLLPSTTYAINVWADRGDVITYSLIVRSPKAQQPDSDSVTPGPEPVSGQEFPAAANQEDAPILPLNTRLEGKVSLGNEQWFAFTTNSAENATYRLTAVNMTRGTGKLDLSVYDRYGEYANGYYTLEADQNGKASTYSLRLPPNTTYYICIWADKGDTISYTLNIHAPDQADTYR